MGRQTNVVWNIQKLVRELESSSDWIVEHMLLKSFQRTAILLKYFEQQTYEHVLVARTRLHRA